IIPNEHYVSKQYLKYALPKRLKEIEDATPFVTVKHLSHKKVLDSKIPLPDLKTQQKIANILAQADAARQKRKQANQLIEQFLQSAFLEMFGDPVRNEKGWEVKRLKEISDKIQIGPFGTQLHEEDYVENGIPLINPRHINSGKIEADFKQTITREKFATLSNYHLKIGDVIMGRRGEMGRCALISKREERWLCGTGSLFIRPSKQISPHYLIFVIGNSSFIKQLENDAQGVTMMNLNLTIVNNRSIPLPPLPLQQKFAALVEKVERLRTKQRESERELENLFQSLMQKYFG
ncbi:MAG: restriction endonuclease subunit S, partial [Cyclobacteriaceae bacterium]|nr:restriction endonuclease subunit S [Cyclobacteriaceae bacterium]